MDILSIFSMVQFIAFLILLSVIGFPFCFLIFKKTDDKGFAFSKLFVALLLSYLSWLVGHIGNFYIFPVILALFCAIGISSYYLFKRNKKNILLFINKQKKIIFFEELIFWIFFIVFLLIRMGNPDLWHPVMGGEKPMDFSFLNAIVRSTSLPPYDPWFSGYTMNYYYFGQFIAATIIKLVNIPPSIFYNLFLAYLFGQVAQAAFSLVWSKTKSKVFSIFGSLLLIVVGNLGQIPVILQHLKSASVPINGWYWTATRVMPNNEINEFPFFSFLYADLHSHLIALPISLLLIGLTFEIYKLLCDKKIKKSLFICLLAGFVLGILRITNIWDYPTFLIFSTGVVFFTSLFYLKVKIYKKLIFGGIFSAILLVVSNVSVLPFILHYKTGPFGVSLYQGPQTRLSDYFTIHGLFLVIFVFFVLFLFNVKSLIKLPKILELLSFIAVAMSIILFYLGFQFLGFLLFLVALIFAITLVEKETIIPALLIAFAIFLTSIPDIFDIKLGLGRMNTVFKFYFQAWIFFSLGSAVASHFIFEKITVSKRLLIPVSIIIGLFFAAALTYPITSSLAKISDRMGLIKRTTLDGTNYMRSSVYFDNNHQIDLIYDLNAINWINKNIKGQPVILEAHTPTYRWGSRISVYTGLPTVLGWDWHEIAHRQYMTANQIQGRASDIQQIYSSTDFETTKILLIRYNVSYIYFGKLEKAYYDTTGIQQVVAQNPSSFEIVYKNSEVIIIKFIDGKHN